MSFHLRAHHHLSTPDLSLLWFHPHAAHHERNGGRSRLRLCGSSRVSLQGWWKYRQADQGKARSEEGSSTYKNAGDLSSAGTPAVEEAKDVGIERYGPQFAVGDSEYYPHTIGQFDDVWCRDCL